MIGRNVYNRPVKDLSFIHRLKALLIDILGNLRARSYSGAPSLQDSLRVLSVRFFSVSSMVGVKSSFAYSANPPFLLIFFRYTILAQKKQIFILSYQEFRNSIEQR